MAMARIHQRRSTEMEVADERRRAVRGLGDDGCAPRVAWGSRQRMEVGCLLPQAKGGGESRGEDGLGLATAAKEDGAPVGVAWGLVEIEDQA